MLRYTALVLERSGKIPWEATCDVYTVLLAHTCTISGYELYGRFSFFFLIRVNANKRAGEDRDDDPGWPSVIEGCESMQKFESGSSKARSSEGWAGIEKRINQYHSSLGIDTKDTVALCDSTRNQP